MYKRQAEALPHAARERGDLFLTLIRDPELLQPMVDSLLGQRPGNVVRPRDVEKELLDGQSLVHRRSCLLYTSDAADERSSVDLGGRRIIKKKNRKQEQMCQSMHTATTTTTTT